MTRHSSRLAPSPSTLLLAALLCACLACHAAARTHLFGKVNRRIGTGIHSNGRTKPFASFSHIFITLPRGGESSEEASQQQQQQRDATMDVDTAGGGAADGNDSDMPSTANEVDNNNDNDDDDNNDSDTAAANMDMETTPSVVVKQHHHNHNHKKSNAVGDPDGEGSSDDEEDDFLSDWDESIIEQEDEAYQDLDSVLERVQVEVEYTVEEDEEEESNGGGGGGDGASSIASGGGSGGVGVRLGQRFKKNKKAGGGGDRHNTQASNMERHLQVAWQPHVYLPPPSDWTYLKEHSRAIDSDGKTRLDRRTLYAGLLLEWTAGTTKTSYRKFLNQDVSQALLAALSLATQPAWRKSLQRSSAIRLYDNNTEGMAPPRGCTLAMQESIALALAHSLGAGLVVLDDAVLSSVQQQLLGHGYSDDDVKPAALIHSVLALARQGALRPSQSAYANGAAISKCMRSDLTSGLDDPFDERAASSSEEMVNWESSWQTENETATATTTTTVSQDRGDIPLVIFLRVQCSTYLLKSKSAVDALLSECNSSDSRNFLVLGKGIDATTVSLPQEPEPQEQQHSHDMNQQAMQAQNMQGTAPWFGFTPHNQNASGQNDPEGSRRFNIFLARTVDPNGTPGIVGAVASPEAGNLFPHMMAMQARQQLEQHGDDDSPAKAELERWAQMLQQQMQTNGGMPMPPPQFFNASLSGSTESGDRPQNIPPPSPEVIQRTLEYAMSELLDRLAQLNEDGASSPDLSPDLQKAFAQVLRNENLRRGIAENLARAAPALSDPKCQGVLLSVFVPPPPFHMNHGKLPGAQSKNQPHNMGGWFQKMLSNQDEADMKKEPTDENRKNSKQKRVRTMAAAAAVKAAQDARDSGKQENKVGRNLAKLEAICRPIILKTPADPVRAKSWEAWIGRERGAVIFRQNRRLLNEQLEKHLLSLQEHTGTRGAGSALRQMLSVRLLTDEMGDVIKRAIELEAAKSQRLHESPDEMHQNEMGLDVDITLSQLLLTEDGLVATEEVLDASKRKDDHSGVQFLHPSSLEAALASVCRISPSPAGGLSVASAPVSHRSRDEISALAQDKHERALVSQVVSPQDIGVTYDMIGGLSEVKELLRQSITYPLKFPHLYSEGIAREAVKGVLLFGPPGTGKTMLAKAVATEGGASFLSVDASSVENKWLGESEKNAKAVFTLARRLAPCVIFIDEVDSLLSSREGSSDDSAHGTLTSVKTTMMSEWDGLNSGTNGAGEAGSDRVVVIGSTNRPFDLDEAVLRRFPRRILVDLPDLETRTEILEVTLAENRLDPVVNLTVIAERLEGYTGSDIKECCREAVVQISHEQAKMLDQGFQNSREDVTEGSLQRLRPVTMDDFEKALSKLKRSVSEKGRELARVWDWNDEYGEIKREKKNHLPHLANMYL